MGGDQPGAERWVTRLLPTTTARLVVLLAVTTVVATGVLTVVDPSAWPIFGLSVVAAVVVVSVTLVVSRRAVSHDRLVDREAAAGVVELERWLSSRRHWA